MLKEQIAVIELLKNLIRGNTEEFSRVTYAPQKPSFWSFGGRTEGMPAEEALWAEGRRSPAAAGAGRLPRRAMRGRTCTTWWCSATAR